MTPGGVPASGSFTYVEEGRRRFPLSTWLAFGVSQEVHASLQL